MNPKNNSTGRPSYVHQLVTEQSLLYPDRTAVKTGSEKISYAELEQKASQIACFIEEFYSKDEIIGVSTSRGIDTIISVYAILLSGRAYLPLDPAYPAVRLHQIVSDSGINLCIAPANDHDLLKSSSLNVVAPADCKPASGSKPVTSQRTQLAYILYTSGSTGNPKGVSMGHAPLVNLLEWQAKESIANAGTTTMQFAPLSFDVSFQEIFATLSTGGTLMLVDDNTRLDPFRLLAFISEHNINRIFLPFVALQQLAETAGNNNTFPACLQEVMTAGEQLKITPQLINLFSTIPGCKLFNQYGPTEAHVVTQLVLEGNAAEWPALPGIGSAITNAKIYIVDEHGELLKNGETGELLISGVCLAEGYLNQPALTAEKFKNWQHPQLGETRVYLSGDLARYMPDGNIEFLGRRDDQVKIRGHRVELGEIEVLINSQPGVEQAVVIARADKAGVKRLLAYVSYNDAAFSTAELRQAVERSLPSYMVPSAFIRVESFPKTTSGKIDKKALPDAEIKRPELNTIFALPASDTAKKICAVWLELLQLDRVGADDNFFDLGGNSLLAVKTVVLLRERFNLELPITKIYEQGSANTLAAFLDKSGDETPVVDFVKKQGSQDIAVIAMAGRFPGASDIEAFWKMLVEGKETTRFFSDDELDGSISTELRNNPDYIRARGVIDGADLFDPAFFGINHKLAALMDPQQRIFLEISWEVLEKAGYLPSRYDGSIGVFAGSGNNTYFINNVIANRELVDQVGQFQVMTANEKDYIATRTAFQLNLKGPAISLNTGCSTSLLAISQAVENIRSGRCELAIAGGVAITAPVKSGQLYEDGAMFSRDGHCRPFDAAAGGTVFSDGAGVVLLKSLDRATEDGDTIYAVVKGVGYNNDGGQKASFTAPSAVGQAGAIRQAIADAGINPADISYIEAHGTATPLGDPIEVEGLKLAFGKQEQSAYCAIGSVKSNMGHLTAAAGVAGFIKTVLALYHKVLPASLHFKSPNPQINFSGTPFFVNSELRAWTTENRNAGVSSFGVGGTNVHVIVSSHTHTKPDVQTDFLPQLFRYSAKTGTSLDNYLARLGDFINEYPENSLADISHSLDNTRQAFAHRRFVVAADRGDAIKKLSAPALAAEKSTLHSQPGKIVFVFPGQGSQFTGMGHELYRHQQVFREAIDECAYLFYELNGFDIRTILYPEVPSPEIETALNDTRYTQPAIFTFSYALAKLWMSWGVRPSVFIGHSIGEFVAAHFAGVMSLQDAVLLIEARGRLMSGLPPGSMLSVRAAISTVRPLIPATISIAAINSPMALVVAGETDEINRFAQQLTDKDIGNRLLLTSHAFHSTMMQPVEARFNELVRSISLKTPSVSIVSSVTGKLLTDQEATDPSYWSGHLVKTVQFSDAINVASLEASIFLEVGPRNVTTMLARQSESAKNLTAIASQQQNASGHSTLSEILQAAGQLWLAGVTANVHGENDKRNYNKTVLPSYAFDKKRYWVEPVLLSPAAEVNQPANNTLTPKTSLEKLQTPSMRKHSIISKIRNILEDASGFELSDASADASFIELGLDSLLLTQVALTLKKNFSVPVSFRQLNEEYTNIDQLATYYDLNLPAEAAATVEGTQHQTQPQQDHAGASAQYFQQADIQQPLQYSHIPMPGAQQVYNNPNPALNLISQQMQLFAQQIAMLQGNYPMAQQSAPLHQPAGVAAIHHQSAATPFNTSAMPAPVPAATGRSQDADITREEAIELKKPFGATARIEKQTLELSPVQRKFLADLTRVYNAKTKNSKNYTQEHRATMADPRVVSGFRPLTKEIVYPLVMNKSRGSRLWDIDGNEYVDLLNGFGSSFLGYQPDIIKKAMHDQIEEGFEIGPQHHLAGPVCKLVCEFTGADRAALCNTGSEAVLGAMRIARTVTGRSLIVAFNGSYHGIVDEVIVRGTKKLKSFPAAPGIMPEAVQNMLILDYGTDESLQIIRERAHELAAVLVEPVQSRRPEFQPVEFLQTVREITRESGTALIFDEVITGFRMHPGGAQALFGIKADLGTYGKVVGAGISIGVIAGTNHFMNALDGGSWQFGDASAPEAGVTYFAGTFVRHPLALAASKASLEYMKSKGPALQESITAKTKKLADGINRIFEKHGLPIFAAQFGSLWKIKFEKEIPYHELLFTLMRNRGYHILDNFPCFLTEAHTEKEIDDCLVAFADSVNEMIVNGFFVATKNAGVTPVSPSESSFRIDTEAPVPGARLGKDANGNPAWFISNPNQPGQYLQINRK